MNKKRIGPTCCPIRFLLLIILFSNFLSSCSNFQPENSNVLSGWKQSHIAWLGSGEPEQPSGSLIAAYYREVGADSQIRLDLLELPDAYRFNLIIALDWSAGGIQFLPDGRPTDISWEALIQCSSDSAPQVIEPSGEVNDQVTPRLFVDSEMDMIVVVWNRLVTKAPLSVLRFQVFLFPSDSTEVAHTPVISADSRFIPSSPLLLVFWNSLPAATPAQALRRWDGAHTGPLGQRHGLNVLLSRSTEFSVPLTLLDLRTPASLSALQYMNKVGAIKESVNKGLITLPSTSWNLESSNNKVVEKSTFESFTTGLPSSPIAYGAFTNPLPVVFSHFFAKLPSSDHILEYQGTRLIPLPPNYPQNSIQEDNHFTASGLSVEVKRQLLSIALSTDPYDLVVLGGNLPNSLWGENTVAKKVFKYITYHPWIYPLSTQQLVDFPSLTVKEWPLDDCENLLCLPLPADYIPKTSSGNSQPSGLTHSQLMRNFSQQLAHANNNVYAKLALDFYTILNNPLIAPPDSDRTSFLSHQLAYLLFASQWANSPTAIASCDFDVDWDGLRECLLSDEHALVIAELDGGRIVLAGSPVALWIGASVPLTTTGVASLPQVPGQKSINEPYLASGAFVNLSSPWASYTPEVSPTIIRLSDNESGIHKNISISQGVLAVEITSELPYYSFLPLTHQSGLIYPFDWTNEESITCQEKECYLNLGSDIFQIRIQNGAFQINSFLDSRPFMTESEDPDRNYPLGHFLPFGLSLISLESLYPGEGQPLRVEFR